MSSSQCYEYPNGLPASHLSVESLPVISENMAYTLSFLRDECTYQNLLKEAQTAEILESSIQARLAVVRPCRSTNNTVASGSRVRGATRSAPTSRRRPTSSRQENSPQETPNDWSTQVTCASGPLGEGKEQTTVRQGFNKDYHFVVSETTMPVREDGGGPFLFWNANYAAPDLFSSLEQFLCDYGDEKFRYAPGPTVALAHAEVTDAQGRTQSFSGEAAASLAARLIQSASEQRHSSTSGVIEGSRCS